METVKIIPTVGRVVYYKAYGTPGGEFPAGVDRAALITDVRKNPVADPLADIYQVRLCVMNPTGIFFSDWLDQADKPGCWDWMPYQKSTNATNSQSAEPRPGVVLNTGTDQAPTAVA